MEPGRQDRPTGQQHIAKLETPVNYMPFGIADTRVQIEWGTINPIEAGKEFSDPTRLISIWYLAQEVAGHLLQSNNVGFMNGLDNAL
jgi:hypothetical protein